MGEKLKNLVQLSSLCLTGLAILVSASGCKTGQVDRSMENRPLIDFHITHGEPVKGLVPWVVSGGEKHHGYYGNLNETEYVMPAINLFDYPF